MDIQKEREAFNNEFGVDDADTFPAFTGGIESSAALKCNWLGWKKRAEYECRENPEKIEIEGLKTIHKLCRFGADHNMEGCSFTEIVERMFDELELAKAQAVPYEPGSFKSSHEIIINETKSELIDGYDIAKEDEYLLESLVYRGVCIGKAQAVPEGFVLVPRVITDEWMAVYVDPVVTKYCKDYEDLPFSVEESELPEIRESHRLPIRNAHKRLMQVIEAQEQADESI
ncbi:hypothetical protein F7P73_14845 [Acinetobacter bohemicus]|uniref:Uncharacterized protein n=1 Tax=Acinetobacter bohemicus TaxID=1435036 RepID=A0A1I6VV34_9GAMM|nr:hypothetical protein [Acinetobacter bohemicus]KAB0650994.1 hypothetical protein F7P73_14845 [Acinetobacter bohemicus]SFT17586.1 hypothetical protein SAMN05444586_103332 [Acinetobacter bohemicus]